VSKQILYGGIEKGGSEFGRFVEGLRNLVGCMKGVLSGVKKIHLEKVVWSQKWEDFI